MNSAYRIGILAALGALIVAGSAFAVSALGSPPPPQLPSDTAITLQTRSDDDGAFTAGTPTPTDPSAASDAPPTTAAPPITAAPPTTQAPAEPVPTQVAPPVETYTAPQPQPQGDDDDGGDDDYNDDGNDDDD